MPDRNEPDPDVVIGDLKLWVHGYERPDSHDFWDGNWLDVTARYEGRGALVEVSGTFLRTDELNTLLLACRAMHTMLTRQACLDTVEPNLRVRLVASNAGRVAVETSITPDHTSQQHVFQHDIDQTYLPEIVRSLERVLKQFPLRGERPRSSVNDRSLRGSVVHEGDIVSPIDDRPEKPL